MRVAAKMTNRLLTDEVISSEEAELVQYGLENFVSTLLGLIAVLLIGGCFGHCPESFMLWLFIFPLRKSAGGFHAKTRIRCWVISVGMLIASFLLFVQLEWHNGVYVGHTVVTAPSGQASSIYVNTDSGYVRLYGRSVSSSSSARVWSPDSTQNYKVLN